MDEDYVGYHSYISDNLPQESPVLYGLHPNAEIGFLTTTSETLFKTESQSNFFLQYILASHIGKF